MLQSSFAHMAGRIDPPSSLTAMDAEELKRKATSENLIVARDGANLLGSVFCRDETPWLYIGKLGVWPHLQGAGVGSRLMAQAERLALEKGLSGLELETRIELTENHAYFGRLGFQKVGADAHAGFDRPTSIRMRKRFEPEN